MIFIKELNLFIKNPLEVPNMTTEIKSILNEDLPKGYSIFVLPKDFESLPKEINPKKHKTVYKVGFLFQILGAILPQSGKIDKYKIIAEMYDFWFTYRQFKDILDEYEKNREKYIKARHLLQSFK